MLSTARILANVANATKSTGPRTTTGLARSSKNALRHGLASAKTIILPNESQEEFDIFCAAMFADFSPIGSAEEFLVEHLVRVSWSILRLARLEGEYLGQTGWVMSSGELTDHFEASARRNRALEAFGLLFSRGKRVIDVAAAGLILDACETALGDESSSILRGGYASAREAFAKATPQPPRVRDVLWFLRGAEERLMQSVRYREWLAACGASNLAAATYKSLEFVHRRSEELNRTANHARACSRTQDLLDQLERLIPVIERYQPRLRRDLSRTLAELLHLQSMRRQRAELRDEANSTERTQRSSSDSTKDHKLRPRSF